MADEFVYYNVNEEDVVYNRTTSLPEAVKLLRQFPNDTLVACTPGSPTDRAHQRKKDAEGDGYKPYTVEVQPALTYTVEVLAKGPAHAVWQADREPMPSPSEMQVIDGWVYLIDDENGRRLYDSEAEGLPDSEEEAIAQDEDNADPADIPDCDDHEPVSVPAVSTQEFLEGGA